MPAASTRCGPLGPSATPNEVVLRGVAVVVDARGDTAGLPLGGGFDPAQAPSATRIVMTAPTSLRTPSRYARSIASISSLQREPSRTGRRIPRCEGAFRGHSRARRARPCGRRLQSEQPGRRVLARVFRTGPLERAVRLLAGRTRAALGG